MRILLVLPMIALTGCLASRMQSTQSQGTDSSSSRFDPAQRLSPTAFEQNATMKDSSVHEDPMTEHEALELLRDALKGITRENLEDARRSVRVLQRTRTLGFQDADSLFQRDQRTGSTSLQSRTPVELGPLHRAPRGNLGGAFLNSPRHRSLEFVCDLSHEDISSSHTDDASRKSGKTGHSICRTEGRRRERREPDGARRER